MNWISSKKIKSLLDCKSKPLSTVMPESLSEMTESLVFEALFLETDDDESPEAVDFGEILPRFDAIRGTRLTDLLLPVEEDPTWGFSRRVRFAVEADDWGWEMRRWCCRRDEAANDSFGIFGAVFNNGLPKMPGMLKPTVEGLLLLVFV